MASTQLGTTASDSGDATESSFDTAVIAGIAGGALILILIIIITVAVVAKRRRKNEPQPEPAMPEFVSARDPSLETTSKAHHGIYGAISLPTYASTTAEWGAQASPYDQLNANEI